MRCTMITDSKCDNPPVVRAGVSECHHILGCCSTHFVRVRARATEYPDGMTLYCTACFGTEYLVKDILWI